MVFAVAPPPILEQNSTSSVGSQPNPTGMKPGLLRRLNHLLCSVAQLKALVSVCISFCCCSVCLAYLTAELPLIVLYLALPLRKLLQCLGCCATVSVCVCVWMQGYGDSNTHLNGLVHVFLHIIPWFFLICSLQLRAGFCHKAGQSPMSDSDDDHYGLISLTVFSGEVTRYIYFFFQRKNFFAVVSSH